jgi:hypothetical protein
MFSSDGKVLQTFDLSPPEEGMRPVQMFFDGADLVVDFVKNTDQGSDQNSFEIIDAFTGTRKSVYRTPDLSGTLACVDHGKFTFLLSSRGHATLQHAFE